ncbi:MAG: hypothetical protein P1P59_07270 [Treponemataceae bacterium]
MKICCIKTNSIDKSIQNKTDAFKVDFDILFKDVEIFWIERNIAETDTNYKQIIPYILVQNSEGKFACYPRHGTETRLHGLYSCGIGGHIDAIDKGKDIFTTIKNGMTRELSEEFKNFQKAKVDLKYLGIINEVETSVGLVHLGLVFYAKCFEDYLPEPAAELSGLEWKTLDEIKLLKMELWSTLAFKLYE